MLKIRLQRVGRKHEPTFRVVLTDSKNSTKSGRAIEILGSHDPRYDDKTVLDADKIKAWIGKGVQLSDTMHNLLISKKVITGKKINVLPKKTVAKTEAPAEAAPAPAAEAPKAEAPVADSTSSPQETPAA